jgi:hypothetical protein
VATAQTYQVDSNNTPLTHDITRLVGNSYCKSWTLQRNTGTAAAVSLTSVTWTLIVSDIPDGTVKLSKTTTTDWLASGIHVDTAASGQFSVYILAADTTTLGVGSYYYEVTATFPAAHADWPSQVNTILRGTLNVVANT